MVVSKRCKVCTALDADNIPIYGEYLNQLLPVLVEKISGIKLDPRKANGVLICKLCAIQIAHADLIIDKLRNSLQRLTKIVKETKTKSPSKEIVSNANLDDSKLKPKSTLMRRKSVFLDSSLLNNKDETKENLETFCTLTTPFTSDLNKGEIKSKAQDERLITASRKDKPSGETENGSATLEIKNVFSAGATSENANSSELSKEFVQNAKSPKKVVRRKSVIPKDSIIDNKEDLQHNAGELKISSTTKFKKIADDKLSEKLKELKPAKRKQILKEDGVAFESFNLNKSESYEQPTPVKRQKSTSISAFEDNTINLDKDEEDFDGSYNEGYVAEVEIKMLNCVICGKGFSKKSSLREHIESSHMGEKLKQCPNCSTEFRSQQKYESHVFNEKCKNSKHACQYPKCNKRFKTVHKMELHMKEKHSSPQQETEVE